MSNSIVFNHGVFYETFPMVSSLNNENWDQTNGNYMLVESDFKPCCLGAHLANYFMSIIGNPSHLIMCKLGTDKLLYTYCQGIELLYKKLGIDPSIINSLLFMCGAPYLPFGTTCLLYTSPSPRDS